MKKLSRRGMPTLLSHYVQILRIHILFPHVHLHYNCYRLSKWPNCSCGTCSGLVTWWLRCTTGASSGMRHIVLYPLPCLMTVLVTLSGGVCPIMCVSSMTHASVLALVVFPQLSPCVCNCLFTPPNPCALGQQVITYCLFLLSYLALCPYRSDRASSYAIVSDFLIVLTAYCSLSPYCSRCSYCAYIHFTTGSISSIRVLPVQTK